MKFICMSEVGGKQLLVRKTGIAAYYLSLVVCFILSACDSDRIYEDNREFKDRVWKVIEEPRFDFAIADTSQRYNLYYNVRNSLEYPYARIFITYHLFDSTGKEL